jgi:hypothetical protein
MAASEDADGDQADDAVLADDRPSDFLLEGNRAFAPFGEFRLGLEDLVQGATLRYRQKGGHDLGKGLDALLSNNIDSRSWPLQIHRVAAR